MAKQLDFRRPPGGSTSTVFEEIPDLPYLEKPVRFSLKSCNIEKFCIRHLSDDEITKLYKRLGYFEQMTWVQIRNLPRENGFSVEKRGGSNYLMLNKIYPSFSTYLHFRVLGSDSPFRVFAALNSDLCYLLLIDCKGAINH